MVKWKKNVIAINDKYFFIIIYLCKFPYNIKLEKTKYFTFFFLSLALLFYTRKDGWVSALGDISQKESKDRWFVLRAFTRL